MRSSVYPLLAKNGLLLFVLSSYHDTSCVNRNVELQYRSRPQFSHSETNLSRLHARDYIRLKTSIKKVTSGITVISTVANFVNVPRLNVHVGKFIFIRSS